jgi:hypothetical protein
MEATADSRQLRILSGFQSYVLRNECVEVAVVPALGARIVSLKDLRTGREWLWHPGTSLRLFSNQTGDCFANSTLAGVDECLPTIAACTWKGRNLPDHGEVWSQAWFLDGPAWAAGEVKTSVNLPVSPLQFQRSLQLAGNEIRLSYLLTNFSSLPEQYLWALHPLLRLQSGDKLVLPPATRATLGNDAWLDAVAAAIPAGGCAKLFAGPLQEGQAAIENPATGDAFVLEWSSSENKKLGLWLTRGGWHGHHHFALEPTNGAPDSLAAAAAQGSVGLLKPGETKSWTVRIRIGTT